LLRSLAGALSWHEHPLFRQDKHLNNRELRLRNELAKVVFRYLERTAVDPPETGLTKRQARRQQKT
jgi:hypothetical protein